MQPRSPGHPRKFKIAAAEAVAVLLSKLQRPNGSNSVDERRLALAMDDAARRYGYARRASRRAFFHGLLTGYSVALKRR